MVVWVKKCSGTNECGPGPDVFTGWCLGVCRLLRV